MAFERGNRFAFKTKQDAMQRKNAAHMCLVCRHNQKETFKVCPQCGAKDQRVYFTSKTELHRGATLLTLFHANKISKLAFQPRFDLIVNGAKLGTYVADAHYYDEAGRYIVEDSKPEKFMDKFAKWKIKHFQAQYGIEVVIPQHKKGN